MPDLRYPIALSDHPSQHHTADGSGLKVRGSRGFIGPGTRTSRRRSHSLLISVAVAAPGDLVAAFRVVFPSYPIRAADFDKVDIEAFATSPES